MSHNPPPETSLESDRPINFRTTSEEVAVGAFVGGLLFGFATLILSIFVGPIGVRIGGSLGKPVLGGSFAICVAFWILPLFFLIKARPLWRLILTIVPGAMYVALIQWHIHQRDIGNVYPWILTALPLGLLLGTFNESIRLACGGSTDLYMDKGVTIVAGVPVYGNRSAPFLFVGIVLGFVVNIFSFGRTRIAAPIAGLLGAGLSALAISALVASRGDADVANLFFGSKWNIAWAGAAIGAISGAISGYLAAGIRERQQKVHAQLFKEQPEEKRVPVDSNLFERFKNAR